MRFVGIDLAWSPRNPSGAAVLSDTGDLLAATATLGDNKAALDFIASSVPGGTPGLIAIDAPLSVPNEAGARACDRQVASIFGRFDAGPYPANRRNLAPYGGLRAELIRQQLQFRGFRHDPYIRQQASTRQVVEVFPHPATVSLFHLQRTLKYKSRPGRDLSSRRSELARLRHYLLSLADADPPLHLSREIAQTAMEGLRGRRFKEAEDLLDAAVCAYSALFAWYHGPRGYAVYGDVDHGHILVPMSTLMWERIKKARLLFLDRDGTLNRRYGSRPPNGPDEVELLPGVASKLHRYVALGWRIVIVTNQGGVAFGYQTESLMQTTHEAVLRALPVAVDASYICPHHPQGTVPSYARDCPNRKPSPGAILDALTRFEARPADCLFVGGMDTDRLAADAAGVPFRWAAEFFCRDTTAPS